MAWESLIVTVRGNIENLLRIFAPHTWIMVIWNEQLLHIPYDHEKKQLYCIRLFVFVLSKCCRWTHGIWRWKLYQSWSSSFSRCSISRSTVPQHLYMETAKLMTLQVNNWIFLGFVFWRQFSPKLYFVINKLELVCKWLY